MSVLGAARVTTRQRTATGIVSGTRTTGRIQEGTMTREQSATAVMIEGAPAVSGPGSGKAADPRGSGRTATVGLATVAVREKTGLSHGEGETITGKAALKANSAEIVVQKTRNVAQREKVAGMAMTVTVRTDDAKGIPPVERRHLLGRMAAGLVSRPNSKRPHHPQPSHPAN